MLARLDFRVVALDFARAAIDKTAPGGGPILGVVADAARLPLGDQTFDLVIQTCFLDRTLFPSLSRLLRPGGLLVVETFGAAQFEATGHPRREFCLQQGELEALCEAPDVGLEIVASSSGNRGQEKKPRHLSAIAARRP